MTDKNGKILASTGIIAGNYNDAFLLKQNLQNAFKSMKKLGLNFKGAYFNADADFDTKDARNACFNYRVIPNFQRTSETERKPKRVARGSITKRSTKEGTLWSVLLPGWTNLGV